MRRFRPILIPITVLCVGCGTSDGTPGIPASEAGSDVTADTDSGQDGTVESGSDAAPDNGLDSGTDAKLDVDSAPPPEAGPDGESGTPDATVDAEADGPDASIDGEFDAETDAKAEAGLLTDCTGQADFTPCFIETTPDRDYDICVKGTCISPGCGDLTCTTPGPHFVLPDSNQRQCMVPGSMVSCPASGDYFGEDAQYGWDVSHPQSARFSITITPSNDRIVLDTVSVLMWQGCPKGKNSPNCSNGILEATTWSEGVTYCDALAIGGYTDWHMPDIYELASIADLSYADPTGVDPTAFPFAELAPIWSSSPYHGMTTAFLVATFYSDFAIDGASANSGHGVRCVRGGGAVPNPRFVRDTSDPSHPFVIDHATGLTWQGCPAGLSGASCELGTLAPKTWKNALAVCETSDWGGHDDWRLPSRPEMLSIVDFGSLSPALNQSVFPGVSLEDVKPYFWTSTVQAGSPFNYAFQVSLNAGWTGREILTDARSVYCVRDAP